jgi:hypothetical protein
VLYLPVSILWWPAAPLAVVIAATAHHRIRTTTDTYATLLETTTRLHATALATQLGIDHTGPLTPQLGHTLPDTSAADPHRTPEHPRRPVFRR